METKLHTFLQSGLLEKYVLGSTTAIENLEVEHYISSYKEVELEYIKLQENLEILSKANAVEAPKFILANVLENIKEKPVINLQDSKNKTPWYYVAASIAAFIFAGSALLLFIHNKALVRDI